MGLVVIAIPPAIIIFIIYKICCFISDVNRLNKENKKRLAEQEEKRKELSKIKFYLRKSFVKGKSGKKLNATH